MNFKLWFESSNKKDCAGILPLAESTGRVLVAFRSSEKDCPRRWEGFGGHLKGDDIEREALRELQEETLYKGKIKLIKSHVYDNGIYSYTNFIGVVPSEFKPRLSNEHTKAKWITYDELLELADKQRGFKEFVNNSAKQLQKVIRGCLVKD